MNIRRNRLWNTHLAGFSMASSMLVLAAGPALAQSGTELSEVVVTGYRASLARALDAKRDEVVAIDSIFAEDIAKFPDLNLADALQRLPGVSIARDAGEGRQISVRGLGPQFTRVRMNGIEALATTGSTDAAGGTNRDRAFDFNVFASELFGQLSVRKTSAAEVEEGSLGATIDLRAARPFDYDGLTVAASGQYGYNDLASNSSPRGALLFSNIFADGKVGALISVAYSERELADEGASTVRWMSGNFGALGDDYAGSATLPELNAAFKPRIPRYDKYIHDQDRLGVTGSLQFQPSERTSVNFDLLYSKFDATRTEMFLQSPTFSAAGSLGGITVQDAEVDDTNTLVYGVFDNVIIRSEMRMDELETEFTQFTADFEHQFNDRWTIRGLAGIAESKHDNPVQTTLLFDHDALTGYSYDYRQNPRLPILTYGNLAVTDPSVWHLQEIRLRPQTTDNDLTTIGADLTWAVNDQLSLVGGVQWKEFEFVTTELRRSNGTQANQEGIIPGPVGATPISEYSQIARLSSGLGVPSGNTTAWLVPDMAAAASLFDLYNPAAFPMGPEPALGNNRSIKEKDLGAFLQLNFRLGDRLRGNVGARYVETDQTSTGFAFVAGSPLLTTATRKYDDVLPALNLAFDATDDIVLRFAAASVMTRPGLGNLNPGGTVSVSGANRTVTFGNPALNPFEADAFDAGFEWYFAPESLFSAALFYKDIKSFVQTIRATGPFSENPFGLPDSVAIAACGVTPNCSPAEDWVFTVPGNTPGGELKGYEVVFQAPFRFLPGFLSNFGTILNYTYVDSDITYLTPTGEVAAQERLTGLSKNAYNATLYYEQGGFAARVSASYRDEYLTTVPGRNGNDIEGTADAMTYDLSDQLTFTLEGLNLTDEANDQWVDSVGNRLSFYHYTGRQFFLGARYRF